jgi:Holliday junction resolvase RusA-like endonuclease
MIITLPWPVSVNRMLSGGSGQQRYKSPAYKLWLLKANAMYKQTPYIQGPVKLHYDFYAPTKREFDLSNMVKVCEDFIVSKAVLDDDNCNVIPEFSAQYRGVDKLNPRVEITITHKD